MNILRANLRNLEEIITAIKESKVLICPTDTVYGLVCNARSQGAVKKLFEIKGRSEEKAIPVFVRDIRMAKRLAIINKEQEKILRKSWPGKITFVLKYKKGKLPQILLGGKKTIGLRIPEYGLLGILLEKLNRPLTGTSANISGNPSSGNIKEIRRQFKDKKQQPDLIIDAGNLPKSKPSTVLDLTAQSLRILRT